jgi:hypothetical protein
LPEPETRSSQVDVRDEESRDKLNEMDLPTFEAAYGHRLGSVDRSWKGKEKERKGSIKGKETRNGVRRSLSAR